MPRDASFDFVNRRVFFLGVWGGKNEEMALSVGSSWASVSRSSLSLQKHAEVLFTLRFSIPCAGSLRIPEAQRTLDWTLFCGFSVFFPEWFCFPFWPLLYMKTQGLNFLPRCSYMRWMTDAFSYGSCGIYWRSWPMAPASLSIWWVIYCLMSAARILSEIECSMFASWHIWWAFGC